MDPLTRLARAAGAGDATALDGFVEASYDQVWRLCAALLGRQHADDFAQETFVRAVRALPGFRGESSARTWLLAIARYTCLDELRARTRRRRNEVAASQEEPVVAGDAGQGLAVADLVGRLEVGRRSAFVLTQMLGLSYEEAARACDCPVGTIRSRVARARRDLLRLLEDEESPGRAGADRRAGGMEGAAPA